MKRKCLSRPSVRFFSLFMNDMENKNSHKFTNLEKAFKRILMLAEFVIAFIGIRAVLSGQYSFYASVFFIAVSLFCIIEGLENIDELNGFGNHHEDDDEPHE